MRFILVFLTLMISTMTGAFAKECSVAFKPATTTGLVTRMTLYKFSDHYELQFLTPAQLPLLDITAEIDGATHRVFLAGGLDDELFMITDDENGIGVSQKMLDALAKGEVLDVKGRNGDDKPESAVFALKGFRAAVKRLKGCG